MILFLSTQALLDVTSGKGNYAAWTKTVSMQDIEISAVSIGQALTTIHTNITNSASRKPFETELNKLLTVLRINQAVIPFEEYTARIWADLQQQTLRYQPPNGPETDLSPSSRMVVATALQRGATLVESQQPYHKNISQLSIVSP